ncbi:hypothetical protein [Anabaena sp. CCY 9910]|uniref:hypothetical protein n=1 Tax=Anabaena sp. CCY 9910 TaxID=3103870 RepID=UPI0039DFFFB2
MKNIFNKKTVIFAIYFSMGLTLGYFLGFIRFHVFFQKIGFVSYNYLHNNLNTMILDNPLVQWFIKNIVNFTPKNAFISDVIAVQGAVIAIALPLSLEIISRISERYQSGVITRKFNQRWEIKLLPILLIIDIFMAVSLKFFGQTDSINGYWKVVAWLTFVIFLMTIYILYVFFKTLRHYTTDTSFLLEQLLKDIEESLSLTTEKIKVDKKTLSRKQKQLVEALEGTGDILVFDTKNKKKNIDIESGLNKIGDKIKQFLDIQKNRPEEFEILLLSEDYLNIHNENPLNAQLLLAFNTEKHLISFTTSVNQLLRVHEAAIEVKNFEIGRHAVYHIIWLLADLCQIPNNRLLIEQLLKTLADIRRNNGEQPDHSILYYVSIRWYINVVFKANFEISSYQDLLDRYFFDSIQYLISEGQIRTFESMVASLIDSGDIRPSANYINIDTYNNLLIDLNYQNYIDFIQNKNIQEQLLKFNKISHNVRTTNKLNECLEVLTNIQKLIEPYFNNYPKDEFQKIDVSIKEFLIANFKYNNLIDIIFSVGAYCIFKEKYNYIKYLWNYKQPADSDAFWIGHDIVPSSLNFLINLYFGNSLSHKRFKLFWENHHGSELYYKQYFLLLLLREFQKNGPSEIQKLINDFRFPDYLDCHSLNNINYSVDNLVEIAQDLKSQIDALKSIGFEITKVVNDIDSGLIPFLENLKPLVELQLKRLIKEQNISHIKVNEFKQNFIKEFTNTTVVRNIMNFLGLYENQINNNSNFQHFYGICEVINKEAFFEEWYSHWFNPGGDFGRGLARDEDSKIIDEIEQYCEEIDVSQLDRILDSLQEDLHNVIIIAINSDLNRFFVKNLNFTRSSSNSSKTLEVKGFKGWYRCKNHEIPVFEVYCNKQDRRILILDKFNLGKITQYSPVMDEDYENLVDSFYINVQSFSENEDLMNSILQNPPDWLTEEGDQVQQRNHLDEKVIIKIYENLEFEKHQDFKGYLIKLTDIDNSNLNDFV